MPRKLKINAGGRAQDVVMLGADYYETEDEVASLISEGRVPIGIGENSKIRSPTRRRTLSILGCSLCHLIVLLVRRNCIIDKNARIGKDVNISNSEVRSLPNFILIPIDLYIYKLIIYIASEVSQMVKAYLFLQLTVGEYSLK